MSDDLEREIDVAHTYAAGYRMIRAYLTSHPRDAWSVVAGEWSVLAQVDEQVGSTPGAAPGTSHDPTSPHHLTVLLLWAIEEFVASRTDEDDPEDLITQIETRARAWEERLESLEEEAGGADDEANGW